MTAAGALGKDLLGLEDLSGDQIRLILDTAEPFKEISERAIKKVPTLRGSTSRPPKARRSVRPCIACNRAKMLT